MTFFEWHEKVTRKVSDRNLRLVILGKLLFWFAVGSYFSVQLATYGYTIMAIGVVFALYYMSNNFMKYIANKKVLYSEHVLGFIGGFFLLLFAGMQTPGFPYNLHMVVIGIVLGIPSLMDLFKK